MLRRVIMKAEPVSSTVQNRFQDSFAMKTSGLEAARAAKKRARAIFTEKASVVGIGITRVGEGYGVKVNLDSAPAADLELPKTIDGVPVRIEVVGPIRPR